MLFIKGSMSATTPVYVTRKEANGSTGSISMSIWMQLLVLVLLWLNIVGWGTYSLYLLATTVF